MSWMLTASGQHAPGADVATWRETEHRLVAELQAVLSKPEYGAVSTWFRGIHLASSTVHHAPETATEADPAAASGPDPAAETKQPGRRGKAAAPADGA